MPPSPSSDPSAVNLTVHGDPAGGFFAETRDALGNYFTHHFPSDMTDEADVAAQAIRSHLAKAKERAQAMAQGVDPAVLQPHVDAAVSSIKSAASSAVADIEAAWSAMRDKAEAWWAEKSGAGQTGSDGSTDPAA